MEELNTLYNQDCLIGMKELPPESIDLVVTDCPYRIVGGGCSKDTNPSGILNKEREYIKGADGKTYLKGTKHQSLGGVFDDAVADVRAGKLFKYNDIDFSEWLPEVYRVLKDRTHCYIMVNGRNLAQLQIEAEKVGFIYQQTLVWRKDNVVMNKYYMNQLEFILMLRKGSAKNVNDMGISNCLSVPNIIGKGKDHHPTAKPVALMSVFIRQSSNKGDIVLDPFAGGGSTLIAAKQLERQYIGFEIDPKYYKMASDRLFHQPQQTSLF